MNLLIYRSLKDASDNVQNAYSYYTIDYIVRLPTNRIPECIKENEFIKLIGIDNRCNTQKALLKEETNGALPLKKYGNKAKGNHQKSFFLPNISVLQPLPSPKRQYLMNQMP